MEPPEAAVLDTSALLRLFHDHGDEEQAGIDTLRDAWLAGSMQLVILDLCVYEFTNVLVRGLGKNADQAARDVSALFDLQLPLVSCDRDLATAAARIAARSRLSGYDAAFVAAAQALAVPLVTTDTAIVDAAPTTAVTPRALTS